VQQACEEVKDIDEHADRCADVVGLTTIDDSAGVEKDEATHQQHHSAGDGHGQRWNLNKQVNQNCAEHNDKANEQHATHKVKALFGG